MSDGPPDRSTLDALEARRAQLRERHLVPPDRRPASTARGLHAQRSRGEVMTAR